MTDPGPTRSNEGGDKEGGTDAQSPVDDAILALLLEVAGTPKPGNVDRRRDLDDLHFESFLGGAIGAREGLEGAANGRNVGVAFERAVRGMADRAGTNVQFGCLLLLVPLLRATADGDLSRSGVDRVTRSTTVDDAVSFYAAFERVEVAVDDPPPDADIFDVRRGRAVEPALRTHEMTLRDVLALGAGPTDPSPEGDQISAPHRIPDRNAQEWIEGFPRVFRAAKHVLADTGPATDRAARAFIAQLASEPDTLVATTHGPGAAREASRRATEMIDGDPTRLADPLAERVDLEAAETLADAFVDEGVNPGTTADLTCGALYVALRRGLEVRS